VLSVAKASQVITFGLDPATATVGDAARTLIASSSSGLPGTLTSSDTKVATITSGNTLNIVGAGTATLTATQTGDGNYEAALPVSVTLSVSASSSTTLGSWIGEMTSAITSTQFSLTAAVRTDNPRLVITPETASDLGGPWSSSSPVITVSNAADQSGLDAGFVRKVYTVYRGTDRARFIRLKTVSNP
jgi:hypothetical protein